MVVRDARCHTAIHVMAVSDQYAHRCVHIVASVFSATAMVTFDAVWPSGTTMGTGLTIVSFVRLWIRSTVDAHKLTAPYGLPGRSPTPIN